MKGAHETAPEDRPVRLKMIWETPAHLRLHPLMVVSFDGTDTTCCADSWCTGDCGYPAAVIVGPAISSMSPAREHKIYGSMVACGDVVQRWRVTWTGEKLVIPSAYWSYLSRRIWL